MTALWMTLCVLSAAPGEKKISAREELARLEKELADQRALLVRMLELQRECTEQMIHAAQGQPAETPVMAEPAPAPMPAPAPVVHHPAPLPVTVRTAKTSEISGTVHVTSGGPAWVFLDETRANATQATLEIKQEEKQFNPRIAAVPLGTKVSFPNFDAVYHNVFSLSAGQAFDLGMVRAGDPVKSKVMTKPGVVEIFCNIHSRMSATVLVTPGSVLAKVGDDGSFRFTDLPIGKHRVSAWAGGQQISTQVVDLGAEGARVQFELTPPTTRPHSTKTGQPYGSYDD